MGVIKQGILGGFQNKVGPVIGSSWKGIATIRSMPVSVANPRTSGQVQQRSRFSVLSKLGSVLLAPIIKPLWDRFAQGESGFNAFVRRNADAFTPNQEIDPAKIVLSQGTVALPEFMVASYVVSSDRLTITWGQPANGDALPSDEFYFVAFHRQANTWIAKATGVPRSEGTYAYQLEETHVPGQQFWYGMFRRADGSKVSNSRMLPF